MSIPRRILIVYWGPPVVWMLLIFLGSSFPGIEADMMARKTSGVEEPVQIQRIKDGVHIFEYGVLTLLLARALAHNTRTLSPKHTFLSFIIATFYGVSDEIHQFFVPLRSPGLDDIVRNTLGAALAAGLAWYFYRCRWSQEMKGNERK